MTSPSPTEPSWTAWKAPTPRYARGVMAKYANTVSSAAEGAVTT